jgi:hypothetical protein
MNHHEYHDDDFWQKFRYNDITCYKHFDTASLYKLLLVQRTEQIHQFSSSHYVIMIFVRKYIISEGDSLCLIRLCRVGTDQVSEEHAQMFTRMGVATGVINVPPREFEVPSGWIYKLYANGNG